MKKQFLLLVMFLCMGEVYAQVIKQPPSIDKKELTATVEKNIQVIAAEGKNGRQELMRTLPKPDQHERASITHLPVTRKKALPAEDLYELCSKHVLMLGVYYNCGKCAKMHVRLDASGVVLNENGLCLTNYHVYKKVVEYTLDSSGEKDSIYFAATMDGKVYPVEKILSYTKKGDALIFKIDTRGSGLSPVPLGTNAWPGQAVTAITNPDGEFFFLSEGVVARQTKDKKEGIDADRTEITADYAVGSSGGPVFDKAGNLIGIASSTYPIYSNADGQSKYAQIIVKVVIPVSTIKRLL